jgi:hypothetical protein
MRISAAPVLILDWQGQLPLSVPVGDCAGCRPDQNPMPAPLELAAKVDK